MRRHLDTAIRMTILTAVLLGLLYPLAITGIAQVVFPGAADGSLVQGRRPRGRLGLIAQAFTQDKYFWPRPSAAGADGYDAMASAASNLGPTSKTLIDRVKAGRADAGQGRSRPRPRAPSRWTWSPRRAAASTPTSPSPTRAPRRRASPRRAA